MKTVLLSCTIVALLLTGCGDKPAPVTAKPAEAPKPAEKSSGSPITAPVDYLGAIAKGKKTAEKVITGTSLEKTLEQFFAQEGRFPLTLDELVTEKYLTAIPAPPYNTKMEYDATKGKIKYVPLPAAPAAK